MPFTIKNTKCKESAVYKSLYIKEDLVKEIEKMRKKIILLLIMLLLV